MYNCLISTKLLQISVKYNTGRSAPGQCSHGQGLGQRAWESFGCDDPYFHSDVPSMRSAVHYEWDVGCEMWDVGCERASEVNLLKCCGVLFAHHQQ
jgi:hypothetical protein